MTTDRKQQALGRFSPGILDGLAELGIRPTAESDPARVRAFVAELYKLELRALRSELRSREAREGRRLRREYSERVRTLRARYRVLAVEGSRWRP